MTQLIRLAVVPVAGLGTRMLPLTKSIPKEMLPVGRKLCIEHIVEELCECGIEEIIWIVSPGKERIVEHFQHDQLLDQRLRSIEQHEIADRLHDQAIGNRVKMTMVYQHTQKGLGDAILCARAAVDGRDFAIALGDSIIQTLAGDTVLKRMCDLWSQEQPDVVIAFQKVARELVSRYGIAVPSGTDGNPDPTNHFDLADLVEKPDLESTPSRLAVSARYILSNKIFDELEKTGLGTGSEIQLTDAVSSLIGKGAMAKGVCLADQETRIDVGSIEGYLTAFIEMAMSDSQFSPALRQEILDKLDLARPK